MDKVLILGDSFAAPEWMTIDEGWKKYKGFTWIDELNKNYDVLNYAVAGSGPMYSLKKLHSWLDPQVHEVKDCYDTTLIFICSDPCRLDLSCYKNPGEAVHIYDHAQNTRRHVSNLFAKQAIQWYMDVDWQIAQSCMYYSIVNEYAQYFKKVLFWPIGGTRFFELVPMSHRDNFYFVNEGLNEITRRDCGESLVGHGIDNRPNHLQEPNHRVMYEQITNWIENDTPIDTSLFRYVGPLNA